MAEVDNTPEQLNNTTTVPASPDAGGAAQPPAESAPATTDASLEAPADTQTEAQPQKAGKPPAEFQKSINRLTRQRGEAERRALRAEAELEALRKLSQPSQPAAQKSASELKESDFANYGEFVKAQARAVAREELAAEREAQAAREAQQSGARAKQSFESEALKQAEAAGIDFESAWETLQSAPHVSPPVAAYIYEAEHKAALVEFLADNPDELARISNLPPAAAFRALVRAEASVGAKPAPNATKAPPPVPTVGGRAVTSFNPEKASMEEYAAEWEKRQAAKYQ